MGQRLSKVFCHQAESVASTDILPGPTAAGLRTSKEPPSDISAALRVLAKAGRPWPSRSAETAQAPKKMVRTIVTESTTRNDIGLPFKSNTLKCLR